VKIRKELWFGFVIMGLIIAGTAVMLIAAPTITRGHLGLMMLALVVVAIMLGFPTAFTLMGMGMIFTWLAYDRDILLQEDVGDRRASKAVFGAGPETVAEVLDAAIDSLARLRFATPRPPRARLRSRAQSDHASVAGRDEGPAGAIRAPASRRVRVKARRTSTRP